jgi:hypothetical protein
MIIKKINSSSANFNLKHTLEAFENHLNSKILLNQYQEFQKDISKKNHLIHIILA